MIRYRIMLVQRANSFHYEVQKKGWFFWNTLKKQVNHYAGTDTYPHFFHTEEEARDFIKEHEKASAEAALRRFVKRTEVAQVQYID